MNDFSGAVTSQFSVTLVGETLGETTKKTHRLSFRIIFTKPVSKPTKKAIEVMPEPVKALIKKIDNSGKVQIRFDAEMITVSNLQDSSNKEKRRLLQDSDGAAKEEEEGRSRVQGSFLSSSDKLNPLNGTFEVFIETSERDPDADLSFNFAVEDFEENKLVLKLEFGKPESVSQGVEPDVLVVKLSDPAAFRDIIGRQVEQDTEVRLPIPP